MRPMNERGGAPCRSRLRSMPHAEPMESRHLLSTADPTGLMAQPAWGFGSGAARGGGGVTITGSPPLGSLSPSQIRAFYGFDQITFPGANGKTVIGDGSGQTIAIVDAFNDPNIIGDLTTFDNFYGIPNYAINAAGQKIPALSVVGQTGGATPKATDAGWGLETALDVEWAHAVAPGARILLVEANSTSLGDMMAAVGYAASQHVGAVSMSWGFNEFPSETWYDATFTTPGTAFVAASGDSGGYYGPIWPSTSPDVLSVGGTTLTKSSSSSTYTGETAWGGSGGGVSYYEPSPAGQANAFSNTFGGRATPDVAYNADKATGVAVYDSFTYQQRQGWYQVGGTSAGTPQWAALTAIADQGRALTGIAGGARLDTSSGDGKNLLTLLYGEAYTLYQKTPSPVFNDITSGSNYVDNGAVGYDLATGLGSPKAAALVRYLATGSATATAAVTAQATVTAGTGHSATTATPTAQTQAIVVILPSSVVTFVTILPPGFALLTPLAPTNTVITTPTAPIGSSPGTVLPSLTTPTGVEVDRGQALEPERVPAPAPVRLSLDKSAPIRDRAPRENLRRSPLFVPLDLVPENGVMPPEAWLLIPLAGADDAPRAPIALVDDATPVVSIDLPEGTSAIAGAAVPAGVVVTGVALWRVWSGRSKPAGDWRRRNRLTS